MTEKKTLEWEDSLGKYTVEVWVEGRDYDQSTESYHPQYAYKIVTPDWEYTANDIRGGANETPNATHGAKSLLAFLYACQEGYAMDLEANAENARLFPPHVRAWAYQNSDELSVLYDDLEGKGDRIKGS